MSVNFPDSPSLNQIYTYQNRSWRWNGQAWTAIMIAFNMRLTNNQISTMEQYFNKKWKLW